MKNLWMSGATAVLLAIAVPALAQPAETEKAPPPKSDAAQTAQPAQAPAAQPAPAVQSAPVPVVVEVSAEARARHTAILAHGGKASQESRTDTDVKLEEQARIVDEKATSEGEDKVAARFAQEFGVTQEVLLEERNTHKIGWGQVMIAHTLAANSGGQVTVADLYQMRQDGAGWGQISAGLGFSMGDVVSGVSDEAKKATGLKPVDGKVSAIEPKSLREGIKLTKPNNKPAPVGGPSDKGKAPPGGSDKDKAPTGGTDKDKTPSGGTDK